MTQELNEVEREIIEAYRATANPRQRAILHLLAKEFAAGIVYVSRTPPIPVDSLGANRTDGELHTPASFRAALRFSGIAVAAWAKANGLSPSIVTDVLRGRALGEYGEAHRAAVLMGLRKGRVE